MLQVAVFFVLIFFHFVFIRQIILWFYYEIKVLLVSRDFIRNFTEWKHIAAKFHCDNCNIFLWSNYFEGLNWSVFLLRRYVCSWEAMNIIRKIKELSMLRNLRMWCQNNINLYIKFHLFFFLYKVWYLKKSRVKY